MIRGEGFSPQTWESASTSRREAEAFAIRRIKECGPEFADSHPEIVNEAKNNTLRELAKRYKVGERYDVTEDMAVSIVREAIRILVPDPHQRAAIFADRLKEIRSRTGTITKEKGVGIWARTPEQKTVDSKKAVARAKEMGVGIFGLTSEQLSRYSRKKSASNREDSWYFEGNKVDGMTEAEYALSLVAQPDFQIFAGRPFAGSPDYTKIRDAVNMRYGKNRARAAVKGFFENIKKRRVKTGSM